MLTVLVRRRALVQAASPIIASLAIVTISARGEEESIKEQPTQPKPVVAANDDTGDEQATREEALAKMLSGATLEGSYTNTAQAHNGAKLDREKYTLGEVKKVAGDVWQFPARIQYGGKDVTLPILLPVKWAGDTPVVVVDTVDLPGFGAVSARVLFFEGHYAGFWKHGDHSGNLFGLIHSAAKTGGGTANESSEKPEKQQTFRVKPSSGSKPPGIQQPQQ